MITREQLKVGEKYKYKDSEKTVIAIGETDVFYKNEDKTSGSFAELIFPIERFLNIVELCPKPKEKALLIIYRFQGESRLSKTVAYSSKERLCACKNKKVEDLEFYYEQEIKSQI